MVLHCRIYDLPEGEALLISLPGLPDLLDEVHAFLGAHFRWEKAGKENTAQSVWRLGVACGSGQWREEARAEMPFTAEENGATPVLGFVEEGNGSFWLTDAEAGTQVRWNLKEKALEVFYQNAGHTVVEAIYTSVRTLVYSLLAKRGARLMHASAVSYRGKAVLLLGEKGAGKTTLASAMLEAGAQFLASDRCWIWRGADSWQVVGWMGTFRLRPEDFWQLFRAPKAASLEAFAESARTCESNYFAGKLRCPPLTFLKLGGWQAAYQAPLHALVELKPSDSGFGLFRNGESSILSLQAHQVHRRLPPPLAPSPNVAPIWPDRAVQRWTYRGRRPPYLMARELCQWLEP